MKSLPSTTTLPLAIVSILILLGVAQAGPKETILHSFAGGTDGAEPIGGLVSGPNGHLYGTTSGGGNGACQGGCGTVFELSPNGDGTWTETQLYSFASEDDGAFPNTGVVFDQAGNLYGATIYGGTNDDGTVFRLTPPAKPGTAWAHTVLYNFVGDVDGEYCLGNLTLDPAGNLYGAALFGGLYGAGTIFQLVPSQQGQAWTLNVLHAFQGTNDGLDPFGAVVLDSRGAVYGTTYSGTVFRLQPPPPGQTAWSLHVLYRLDSIAAVGPLLVRHPIALYGTTALGGATNDGTIFQLTPPNQPGASWNATTLYEFKGGADGWYPLNGLVADRSGQLYGVTASGGAFDSGTVFRLSPGQGGSWTKTTLYQFKGGRDASGPGAGVILGQRALFGTTSSGGLSNLGTVFQLAP